MRQLRRYVSRYWGFLVLIIAFGGWRTKELTFAAILILSVLAVVYFLFLAPLWCGSVIRDGMLCRNNSSGMLIGCHLRQHKWQKLKMIVVPKKWHELNRGLWASPREGMTTIGGIASVVSCLAAVIAVLNE